MKKIFLGSLLISIWTVILFWGKNIGLSMLLFIAPFIYFLIGLLENKNKIEYKEAKILIIPIVVLASTYFIFDNSFFNKLNIVVIPVLIILMIIKLMEKNLDIDKFFLRFVELILDPLTYIEATMKDLKKYILSMFKIKGKTEKNSSIGKAILITIPLVIIVIALLSSADEIFGKIFLTGIFNILNVIFEFDLTNIILKIAVIIALFIYFSSFFNHIIYEYKPKDEEFQKLQIKDITTTKMVLTALNVVYILFCFIQIKALFLGKDDVSNYSQYARKGFFQLMFVSFINLVVILISKKCEKNKYINSMCLVMIACTFVILLSSGVRMFFYESAYGYTRLRLLVYVALLTEAILLIPTIAYVIDKKINLPKVYMAIIIVMYVGINMANIDNIITKSNVDRYFKIGVFDVDYLKKETGADAIKELIRIKNSEPETIEAEEVKNGVSKYLATFYEELEKEEMDFRDFNLSKIIAKSLY